MTREEILEMEPGRGLDELMEGSIFKHPWFGLLMAYIPPYSTNILAAWEVFEKIPLAIFRLNNGDYVCCKASYIYHIDITKDHYEDPNLVICKEAPEAICKMGLLEHFALGGVQ